MNSQQTFKMLQELFPFIIFSLPLQLLIFSDSLTADDRTEDFLNVFCLSTAIGAYVLLLDVTYTSFREVLSKFYNWWQRGGRMVVIQMAHNGASSMESFNNALLRPPQQ